MTRIKQQTLQNYILYTVLLIFFTFLIVICLLTSLLGFVAVLTGMVIFTFYKIVNMVQYYEIEKESIIVKKLFLLKKTTIDENTKFILIKNNKNLIDEIQIKSRIDIIKIFKYKDNLEPIVTFLKNNNFKTEEEFPLYVTSKIFTSYNKINTILFFAALLVIIEFLVMSMTISYPLISKGIFYIFIGLTWPIFHIFTLIENKTGFQLKELYIFFFSFMNNFLVLLLINLIVYKEQIRNLKINSKK